MTEINTWEELVARERMLAGLDDEEEETEDDYYDRLAGDPLDWDAEPGEVW